MKKDLKYFRLSSGQQKRRKEEIIRDYNKLFDDYIINYKKSRKY